MKHLTVEQITEFVGMKKLDPHALELAANVTTHIRACSACMRKVRAYQLVQDGMERQLLLTPEGMPELLAMEQAHPDTDP